MRVAGVAVLGVVEGEAESRLVQRREGARGWWAERRNGEADPVARRWGRGESKLVLCVRDWCLVFRRGM